MSLIYDYRGMPYDALMASVPVGLRVNCNPLTMGLNPQVCPRDCLVGAKAGLVGLQPQLLTTNFNTRIQHIFRSRMDRGLKVKRSVKCEACGITLNSEQQAKQHYKGKFHQRKLRQQTQRSTISNDTIEFTENSKGVKRPSHKIDEECANQTIKQCRMEAESGMTNEDSNPRPEVSSSEAETAAADVEAPSKKKQTMQVAEESYKKDARIDAKSQNRIIQIQKLTHKKELEISIEMKNSHRNSSAKVAIEPISMPITGHPYFTPLSQPGLPTGVLLANHPVVTCPSFVFQPPVISLQGSWLPKTILPQHFNTQGMNANAVFYGAQNSMNPVISGLVNAQQRMIAGHSNQAPEFSITSGLPIPVAVMHPVPYLQNETLDKSLKWNSEMDKTLKQQDKTSLSYELISAQYDLSKHSTVANACCWKQRPDLIQVAEPVSTLRDLDRMDPVSKAVYNNVLGIFSTKKSRSRFESHHN